MDKVKKNYASDNIKEYHYIVLVLGAEACVDFS